MIDKKANSEKHTNESLSDHSSFIARVSDAFDQVDGLTGEARDAFFIALRSNDPDVARRLEDILDTQLDVDAFFETLLSAAPPKDGATEFVGHEIGGYRLEEQIGEGGMGIVYRARNQEQQFEQEVAIKILRQRWLSSSIAMRFAQEAQILVGLDHTNIAKIHNAGTYNHYPFLIMELVEGTRLDTYCLSRKLTIRQRLKLFTTVLDAVAYAQSQGVIHRDLKPRNILVTNGGRVKLLDFGVAKIVADDADAQNELTRMHGPIVSAEIAAPEQWRSELQKMATDVYALGIVLFKLLCGDFPFTRDEINKAQNDENWPMPMPTMLEALETSAGVDLVAENRRCSTKELQTVLTGDLQAIVRKATRYDITERYMFASDLRRDIARYLENRPVEASVSHPVATARKWIQRHRGVSAVSAALIITIAVALLQTYFKARTDIKHAVEIALERDKAQAIANVFKASLSAADPAFEGANMLTVREALIRTAEQVLSDQKTNPSTRMELALTIGQVLTTLGAFEEARPLFELVAEISAQLPNDEVARRAKVDASVGLIDVNIGRGKYSEALDTLPIVTDAISAIFEQPSDRMLALLNSHAEIYLNRNMAEKALEHATIAHEYAMSHTSLNAEARSLAVSNLAFASRGKKPLATIVALLEDARMMALAELPEAHPAVARITANLAAGYFASGDSEAAETSYNLVISSIDSQGVAPNRSMAQAAYGLGAIKLGKGEFAAATNLINQALDIQLRFRGPLDAQSLVIRFAHASAADLANKQSLAKDQLEELYSDIEQLTEYSGLTHRVLMRLAAIDVDQRDIPKARGRVEQAKIEFQSAARVTPTQKHFLQALQIMTEQHQASSRNRSETLRELLHAIEEDSGQFALPAIKIRNWLERD